MDNSITPETQQHIRALCDDIATAESLTEDLHDELYTHIEEKILGYLSGEETLSEADAFLLAREHFGDRATMRHQPKGYNPIKSVVNLNRYLISKNFIIPAIVFMALAIPSRLMYLAGNMLPVPNLPIRLRIIILACYALGTIVFLLIQFALLQSWKRKELEGRSTWYQKWTTGKLFALFLATLILHKCVWLASGILMASHSQWFPIANTSSPNFFYVRLIMIVLFVGTTLTWLKWNGVSSKNTWASFTAVLSFTMLHGLFMTLHYLFRVRTSWSIPDHSPTNGPVEIVTTWYIETSMNPTIIYLNMKSAFIPAFLTWIVYALWTHFINRRNNTSGLVIAKR